jgi:signal transduction histidine kinase
MTPLLARVPRESKVAAVVLAAALLQVGVLAALGLGQAERRREDAEQALVARAERALTGLVARSVRQVAAEEDLFRAELARDEVPAPARALEALRTASLFSTVHLVDARGEPFDATRLPFDPPETAIDLRARRVVDELLAMEAADRPGAAGAAAAVADELERTSPRDRVAIAIALQCGARSALASGDPQQALDLARRLLDRDRAVRDDRAVEGESEPFGPSASLVACETLLSALPTGDDAAHAAFVDAVLDRRVGAQRLRGVLSETGYRVERDDCLRLRRAATALRIEHQNRLDAALRECDAVDAALDLVRSAPRAQVLSAVARGESVRIPLDDGSLVVATPVPRGGPWIAAAFTARPADLRAAALVPEVERLDVPEGVVVLVRDGAGAVVAGRDPGGSPRTLAEASLGAAFPRLAATALLADPSFVERETDAARSYWLWVLGASILGVVAASLLAIRAVSREVRLARLKSDFASNLSHELRTPLTSLRMFVDTLREGRVRDPQEAKECLDVIAQETERLSSLVERILQFAAFAKGRAPIELKSADAGEVARRAVQLFRKRAEAAGASLEARIEPALPESILDRDAVVQVVLNLLDNAVKHSGEKSPRVRVTVRPEPPGGGRGVAILVEDDGPGVPERERELVFEEFYRGDDTLSRRTQGAGLGLALSKRIVLAHGGVLDVVRSEDLGGACFRVRLPDADTGRRLAVAAQQGGTR